MFCVLLSDKGKTHKHMVCPLAQLVRPRAPYVSMVTRPTLQWERGRFGCVKWGRNNFLNVQEPNWNFNPLSQAPANKAHAWGQQLSSMLRYLSLTHRVLFAACSTNVSCQIKGCVSGLIFNLYFWILQFIDIFKALELTVNFLMQLHKDSFSNAICQMECLWNYSRALGLSF